MRQPYPLQWPIGWDRTPTERRERALFRVSLTEGIQDLLYDLRLMGATEVVITSDLPTNTKGLPYSSGRCEDPGIAVWVVIGGVERVFACDRWTTPAANLRAIGKTVDAIRGISHWGAADMVTRAFSGFAALPAGSEPTQNPLQPILKTGWREVLGVDQYKTVLKPRDTAAKRELLAFARKLHRVQIRLVHPDVGGTHERAAELNAALQEAEAELGGA